MIYLVSAVLYNKTIANDKLHTLEDRNMKRITALISALIMIFTLAGCGGTDSSSQAESAASFVTESKAEDTSSEETSSEENEDSSPYTLNGDFSKGPSKKWEASDGWSNGGMFNCTWKASNADFKDGHLDLTISKAWDDSYYGAEYRTKDFYGYGLYEVSMKPISNKGVVSSFFTYTGPSDSNPWDEIDIEFLGYNTTKVQFNYFTNGVGNHEYLYDLGFDASEEFHTYGFRWEKDSITWLVDGVEVYTATENIPSTPGKLMMNVWNGIGVVSWLRKFDGNTPITAEYQWARFTAAE